MKKLLGGFFVTVLVLGGYYFYPRVQTGAVREIPVVASVDETDRSPASVDTTHFQINDETLVKLEKSREHLREFAKAEPTAGGWTIHIMPGDKIFAKTGIRDGDLISMKELRAQAESAHEPGLADRFVDILRQIED